MNRPLPAFAKPVSDARRRGLTLRDPRQWAVTVPKSSGSRIVFGKYDQRHEAETVAAALRNVGCAATVLPEPRGTP